MSPTQNTTVIFNEIPKGAPDANTLIVDDKATIDLDGPLNGGFIVKTLCFSLDPYMRGRMRDPSIKSYVPAFELHKPYVLSPSPGNVYSNKTSDRPVGLDRLSNFAVAKVLRSESSKFKEGDHIYGHLRERACFLIPLVHRLKHNAHSLLQHSRPTSNVTTTRVSESS